MFTIYPSNGAQSPEDFFYQFKKECLLSIKNNKALTVAFLAYNLDNPEIVKMLLDPAQWSAIDYATGGRIALFYINPDDLIKRTQKEAIESSKSIRKPKIILPSSERIEKLVPLEVLNLESLNPYLQYLLQQLEYDEYSQPKVPFLIFIKTDGEKITDNFAVEIKYKNRINVNDFDACNELLRIIKNVTLQLQNIKYENNPDKDTIFNLVKLATADTAIFDYLIVFIKKGLDILLNKYI